MKKITIIKLYIYNKTFKNKLYKKFFKNDYIYISRKFDCGEYLEFKVIKKQKEIVKKVIEYFKINTNKYNQVNDQKKTQLRLKSIDDKQLIENNSYFIETRSWNELIQIEFELKKYATNLYISGVYVNFLELILLSTLFSKHGIKNGYLSLKSNKIFFRKQIQNSKKSIKYFEELICKINKKKYFVASKVNKSNKKFKIIYNVYRKINKFVKNNPNSINKKNLEELSKVSDFHKKIISNKDFSTFYNSIEFNSYRYFLSWIYESLINFGFNYFYKNALIEIAVDIVESYDQW